MGLSVVFCLLEAPFLVAGEVADRLGGMVAVMVIGVVLWKVIVDNVGMRDGVVSWQEVETKLDRGDCVCGGRDVMLVG
jgi:hypothetical protein